MSRLNQLKTYFKPIDFEWLMNNPVADIDMETYPSKIRFSFYFTYQEDKHARLILDVEKIDNNFYHIEMENSQEQGVSEWGVEKKDILESIYRCFDEMAAKGYIIEEK